ncbi:facilitated trehalose transporter Tret1-like [Uranotaenia lowii]|uniref:facilitated trehalose transporter Tret1-like n=1 Tax=Uranotaenia lowii TaxID=190385 RepID=UPI0024793686|nr:facilitated trehalose transporter Tret1-like [Uranotaenia lowii]
MTRTGVFHQVITTCIVNIISLSYGAVLGWVSPFLPLLQSDQSPLDTGPVTIEQSSWIGSILCIGAMLGALIFGILAPMIGVKKAIHCLCIPNATFWLLVYFGSTVYHLYVARFVAGFCGGGVFVTFPIFVANISDRKIRGVLGSLLAFSVNSGILLMYIVGQWLSYRTVPIVMIFLPVAFSVLLVLIPETPQSLLKQRRLPEAERSLLFYKGYRNQDLQSSNFELEFEQLKSCVQDVKVDHQKLQFSDFASAAACKGILIGIFLVFLNQFCGIFAILTYAVTIFEKSGSSLGPGTSSIIIGAIQVVGIIGSSILIDLAGRKLLLMVSTFGTGLGMITLGMYSWLEIHNVNLEGFGWIPVVSLSFGVFMYCVGLCNIPFFLLPEILPAKICNVGNTISMVSLCLFAFIALKIVPVLMNTIELYGVFSIFASTCFLGMIVIGAFIPETKGKNFQELERIMGKGRGLCSMKPTQSRGKKIRPGVIFFESIISDRGSPIGVLLPRNPLDSMFHCHIDEQFPQSQAIPTTCHHVAAHSRGPPSSRKVENNHQPGNFSLSGGEYVQSDKRTENRHESTAPREQNSCSHRKHVENSRRFQLARARGCVLVRQPIKGAFFMRLGVICYQTARPSRWAEEINSVNSSDK